LKNRCVVRNASRRELLLSYLLRVLVIVGPAALAACGMAMPAPLSSDGPTAALAEPDFKLAKGEKVRVTVSGEDKLSGEFTISRAGSIVFPPVGKLQAAGLSRRELEETLAVRLRARHVVDPNVSVEVLTRRPVYVTGEVRNAGEFPYKPGLNVVTAVLQAGGYGPRASTSVVFIKRASGGEEQKFPTRSNVPVYPGDIIRVPELL
jgi:polysaccharide export outer membrane protein